MKFRLPPRVTNANGQDRKAGFELEFAGIGGDEIAALILQRWGGRLEEQNHFHLRVVNTRLGTFTIELDARVLSDQEYLSHLKKLGIELSTVEEHQWVERLLENIATVAVPWEVGTPPLPFPQIAEVEKLREGLHRRNALGTKARYIYAFGLHINIEIPELTSETILAYLRSFLVHYPWLLHELKIDFSRRVTPHIQPFPEAYTKLVLDPSYAPPTADFVRDYLIHNPTRNRPLDLLPILCLLDDKAVGELVTDTKKPKPRPAFHYRLPNCLIDDPEWRIARDWNYWVEIEELAYAPDKLLTLSNDLLAEMSASPVLWKTIWADRFAKERPQHHGEHPIPA